MPRLLLLLLWLTLINMALALEMNAQLISQVTKEYGRIAGQRVASWQRLMTSSKEVSVTQALELVNDFFNRIRFVEDSQHWHVEDYWATPLELLATNGGDCEDFAIAKYFTLLELGVPEDKLKLTYVKALATDQAHMVLTYYPDAQGTPLVLDNINPTILPATERTDLVPVYTFNGRGLWLAKSAGQGRLIGDAERLDPWHQLRKRMASLE
jgi:predicted transglutaminase-like cysteine proteinase